MISSRFLRRFTAAALLLAAASISTAASASAQEVIEAPQGFKFLIPGKAVHDASSIELPDGGVQRAAWTSNMDSVVYSVVVTEYPDSLVRGRKGEIAVMTNGVVLSRRLNGTIEREAGGEFTGRRAHEFLIVSDAGEFRARNVLFGRYVITMLVLYDPSMRRWGSSTADGFFMMLSVPGGAGGR